MTPFKSVVQPSTAPPKAVASRSDPNAFIRDQFSTSTWLLLGASVHGLFSILLPKTAVYLSVFVFAVLAYYFANTMLQVYGIIPNPGMANVIPGKVSAQLPDLYGNMPSTEPSTESVVVMFLSLKSNHPLRLLAPGYKKITDYFSSMLQSLDNPQGREKYGFLGMNSYLGNESSVSNQILTISYWRNIEGVHDYAESPLHREAWDYWNRTAKEHPCLSIHHEIYRAEPTQHENIFLNFPPNLIGATAFPSKSDDKQEQWVSPLVEAKKGVLATTYGRLGQKAH